MSFPKVSIIIPVYNCKQYIYRCIRSCINQSLKDIEIIVIDDKSNDSSIDMIEDITKADTRIKVYQNKNNIGTFHTRINGINYAEGEYLLFVDGDDYIEPRTCEILYQYAINGFNDTNEYPDVVFFGSKLYPRTIKKVLPVVITEKLLNDEILYECFIKYATPPWHVWGKLYKTQHAKQVAKILKCNVNSHLIMAEDALTNLVILSLAKKTIGIEDKLYIYCNNSQSITRRTDIAAMHKKISDLNAIIDYTNKLEKAGGIGNNKYYKDSKNKMQNILKAQIELEYRYLSKRELNSIAVRGAA